MHAQPAFFAPSPSPSRQLGGTLLGLILGIVIGLGIALGVALYMAKVPVPFIHKASSRSTEQDAAEAERNRDWNPNAPLRSRTPPAPATAPAATPATRPVPAPAEVSRPATQAAPAPTQAQQTTSSDPLGDFIAARTARQNTPAPQPEAHAAAAAAEPFIYFVQAGAYRDPEEAQAQRARLTLTGMQARVTSHEQAGRAVYRVRVGPYQSKAEADSAKERVANNGFEAVLVRMPR